ncbi:hypothetical protein [uncultured Tateyamaria sp.]|uniref:hypothetical protein n=1 Tax=Tateyamaria sp. 1078 TaxID=3417464 RepID=UPI00261EAE34|nr:hypothetical protein [uncultured Tateyamaria sp.]
MFQPKPGTKADPARRWALSDRAFFAHGACHILAGVCLHDWQHGGLWAERIIPNGPNPRNHIYVTDGTLCLDYRGTTSRDRLLAWNATRMTQRIPGWRGTVALVRFDLLDTRALNARKMRGPDQYLHDPIARARAFLASRHAPSPSLSPKNPPRRAGLPKAAHPLMSAP